MQLFRLERWGPEKVATSGLPRALYRSMATRIGYSSDSARRLPQTLWDAAALLLLLLVLFSLR